MLTGQSAKKISSKLKFLPGLIVAGLAAALYANTTRNGFVYDDSAAVTNNYMVKEGVRGIPELLRTPYHRGYFVREEPEETYRPISLVVFAVIYQFFKENPLPYHLLNIFLYVLTGFFLYSVLKKILPEKSDEGHGRGDEHPLQSSIFSRFKFSIPFIASLIFIAHPIHTEVVANIKSADELLSFLFVLFTLFFILRYLEKGSAFVKVKQESNNSQHQNAILPPATAPESFNWGFILRPASFIPFLAMICLFLALMSKEGAITMLAVIPVTLYFFKNVRGKKLISMFVLLLLPTVFYFLMRKMALGNFSGTRAILFNDNILSAAPDIYTRLATAFYILMYYLKLLVFPHPLSCDYSPNQFVLTTWSNPLAIISVVFHAGLLAYALFGIRKKKISSYAILFYLITMSLYSNVIILIGTHFAERLLYIPSLGFAIVIALMLFQIRSIQQSHISKLLPAVASCILLLIIVAFSYKTIARNANWKDGLTLFAADTKHSPNSARMHYLYGERIIIDKLWDKPPGAEKLKWANIAMAELNKTIEIYPTYADAYGQRGLIYYMDGNQQLAFDNYTRSVGLKTSSENIYNNYGILCRDFGQHEKALELFQQTVLYNPRSVQGWQNMGSEYAALKKFDLARKAYLTALSYKPEDANLNFCTGSLYFLLGDSIPAKPYFEKAYRLDPKLKKATNPFKK